MILVPFDYQLEAISDLRGARGRGQRRLLLCMLMGAGKSLVALELMRLCQEKGRRALFLCDRRMLADQIVERAREQGLHAGQILSGRYPDSSAACQFASRQTVDSWLKSGRLTLPEFDLVVTDEAHRAVSDKWQALLGRWPAATLVGLTATPCLGNGNGMGAYYDYLCQPIKPSQLLALGRNVPVRAFAPHVPKLKGVKKDANGDYQAKSLSERMRRENMVGGVADWWLKLAHGRPSIYFACDVAHAMQIVEEFRKAAVSAELICDETPDDERASIQRRLSLGHLEVVVNCDVLCEGVDWPFVSCIGLVRPTKRLRRYLQAAGRGMRAAEGKTDMILIDHAGCVLYHGFPDEDRLWPLSPDDNVDKQKAAEKKEVRPIRCAQCHHIFKGRICPACGHVNAATRKASDGARGNGTLVEATRNELSPEESRTLMQRFWYVCIGTSIKLERHAGMAAGMFSKKFGIPPWQAGVTPMPDSWKMPACDAFPGFVRKKEVVAE